MQSADYGELVEKVELMRENEMKGGKKMKENSKREAFTEFFNIIMKTYFKNETQIISLEQKERVSQRK